MHTERDSFDDRQSCEIHVVSSDLSFREQIHRWVSGRGIKARSFAQMGDLLHHYVVTSAGCLVLDVRTLGALGLSSVTALRKVHDYCQPVIVVTRGDDVFAAVTAMKLGAYDVMHEPFSEQTMTERIQQAIEQDRACQREYSSRTSARRAIHSLTVREREVLSHLLQGSDNKEIAVGLGMNSKTASTHRVNIMQKMGAANIVDLVRKLSTIEQRV